MSITLKQLWLLFKDSFFRLLIFLAIFIFIGLAQVWVLSYVLYNDQVDIKLIFFLRDGSLFFTANALVVTSFIAHKKIITNKKSSEFSFAIIVLIAILLISNIPYALAIKTNTLKTDFYFSFKQFQYNLQFACLITAIFYGFFVDLRTYQKYRRKLTIYK